MDTEAIPNFGANAHPNVVLPTPGAPPIKNTSFSFLLTRASLRNGIDAWIGISCAEAGLLWAQRGAVFGNHRSPRRLFALGKERVFSEQPQRAAVVARAGRSADRFYGGHVKAVAVG